MRLERSALRAILVWAFALTLWLGVVSYQSFEEKPSVTQPCCEVKRESRSSGGSINPLTFELKLFTVNGVNVSFIYGIDGNPTRIALNRETCS